MDDQRHHHPSRAAFVALAAEHGVVPVWREVLGDLDTPLGVYAKLRGDGPSFLLESAEHGERWGRYSFVGIAPEAVLVARGGEVSWAGVTPPGVAEVLAADGGVLDVLAAALAAFRAPPELEGLGAPLHGGAVGMLGYDVVREVEQLPEAGVDDLGLPDAWMMFPRHVLGLDHLRQTITVVTNVVVDGLDAEAAAEAWDEACAATDAVVDRLATTVATPAATPPGVVRPDRAPSNMAPSDYEAMVAVVKEHIRAGDTFQTVVSQRFALETAADPFDVYRALRVINPSPYLYLFDVPASAGADDESDPTAHGAFQVVGSSPEALVQVHDRHVETWPIAGTRPRGVDREQDAKYADELVRSTKEVAEHVMLVDLARNDLGRVSDIGTVSVDQMMDVERYSHVMHLVSAVTGRLRDGLGPVDVLRAVFPAGTVSGAPKVRAMEIIDELEPTRRGLYAGAIGYLDLRGNLDTCIALRTVVLHDGVAYVQAGAGIVADSVPSDEEAETRSKAGAVLAAVEAAARLRS